MPYWYEVFDNEQVQLVTRKQAAMLTSVATAAVILTVASLALGANGTLPMPLVGGLLLAVWAAAVRWIAARLRRLRSIVWCVKISDRCVVGYDYMRKKTTIDWMKVERLDLTSSGIVLRGPAPCLLEIPHLFPDFAELSHRLVHYAECYGVPVYLDGKPWQHLNVYALFPFLEDGPSSGPPGTLRV